MSSGFSIFEFLPLSFFSFSFLFAAVIDLLLGLLTVKKLLKERVIETANFYHGAARCSVYLHVKWSAQLK